MKILNPFISWFFRKRIGQVEEFILYPHEVQQKLFHNLISKGKHTEFGEKHGFASVKTLSAYQNQVPIRNYETMFPYIERLMKGEQNILWPTEIKWFAKSSGTTSGKSKFIPVSKETLEDCHFKGGKDAMTLYCHNNPETNVFGGKSLIMGGSHQVNEYNSETSYGDVSAVMMQNMPLLGHFLRTPDLRTALMDEWEEKLEKIAQKTIHENVTNFAGVPTWTLVLMKRVLEITGKNNILEIWPDLELFVHGGINFEPYREIFEHLIPGNQMNYYQMYNASEGFFAMQDKNNISDMLLMLDYGIYYEFIPREELNKEFPKAVSLSEVEAGKLYALVITTNSGLWRYNVGDTITFTSTNPYKIKVTGRTKSFINAFGEELIVENADNAIQFASAETNAIVREYTAAPIYFAGEEKAAHEWLIEFEKEPADKELFISILDRKLQEINSDYEAKRHKSLALEMPKVHFVPTGTFQLWLKSKGKQGGQHKVPRLKNDRTVIDEVKQFLRT